MARIYSRKKGKSGSTRPLRTTCPNWVRYSTKEVEKLILKLRKNGHSTAEIGLILRDSYGIPSVKLVCEKRISQVLKENKMEGKLPEDMSNLIKKAVKIRKHLTQNPKDLHTRYGLQMTESKIRRLVKYYKKKNVLTQDWKYNPAKASLLVE